MNPVWKTNLIKTMDDKELLYYAYNNVGALKHNNTTVCNYYTALVLVHYGSKNILINNVKDIHVESFMGIMLKTQLAIITKGNTPLDIMNNK